MKSNITFFVLVASSLLFISCEKVKQEETSNLNNTSSQSNSTLAGKIESMNKIFEKAIMKGDFESLLQYYTDDIIVSPDLEPSVKGKAALKEIYEKNEKRGIKYHSFSGTSEDIWECSDKVYERGTFGLSVSSREHRKPLAYYGTYFTIWQKENDGSLKIKYVIWNLDFNPYEG